MRKLSSNSFRDNMIEENSFVTMGENLLIEVLMDSCFRLSWC